MRLLQRFSARCQICLRLDHCNLGLLERLVTRLQFNSQLLALRLGCGQLGLEPTQFTPQRLPSLRLFGQRRGASGQLVGLLFDLSTQGCQLRGLFGLRLVGIGRLLAFVQEQLLQLFLHLVHLQQQQFVLALQLSNLGLALISQLLGCRQGSSLGLHFLRQLLLRRLRLLQSFNARCQIRLRLGHCGLELLERLVTRRQFNSQLLALRLGCGQVGLELPQFTLQRLSSLRLFGQRRSASGQLVGLLFDLSTQGCQLRGLFGLRLVGIGRLLAFVQEQLLQLFLHLVHLQQHQFVLALQLSSLGLALINQLLGCRQGSSLGLHLLPQLLLRRLRLLQSFSARCQIRLRLGHCGLGLLERLVTRCQLSSQLLA
ncbi:MAG: hypothetical protein QE285_19475, partial [Aquabacterium sp.]|nr:hypothetical protein [Aquabacterium sp.]